MSYAYRNVSWDQLLEDVDSDDNEVSSEAKEFVYTHMDKVWKDVLPMLQSEDFHKIL